MSEFVIGEGGSSREACGWINAVFPFAELLFGVIFSELPGGLVAVLGGVESFWGDFGLVRCSLERFGLSLSIKYFCGPFQGCVNSSKTYEIASFLV